MSKDNNEMKDFLKLLFTGIAVTLAGLFAAFFLDGRLAPATILCAGGIIIIGFALKKKGVKLTLTAIVLGCAAIGTFFCFAITGHRWLGASFYLLDAAILWFHYIKKVPEGKLKKLADALYKISLYALIAFLFFFIITEFMLVQSAQYPENDNADYIIVLGAGVNGTEPSLSLKYRLNTTYEYLVNHPECIAVLSGGMGEYEEITEAQCMYDWLLDKGIDESRLIKEEHAESTGENVEYSVKIILESGAGGDAVIGLVSAEYHMLRAKMVALSCGYNVVCIPSKTDMPTLKINYYIREAFAIWYYMIFR